MLLSWHDYHYYPYEKNLALREVRSLFPGPAVRETSRGIELEADGNPWKDVKDSRLVYFADIVHGRNRLPTLQSRLEATARSGKARQATRYSVHGLHEYKGKFNPQVVKVLLNILAITPDHYVLDPFCGSGTTLVECSHMGIPSYGIDINPLAVFVSNAKLQALSVTAARLYKILESLVAHLTDQNEGYEDNGDDSDRIAYLQAWFSPDILRTIERLRCSIERIARDEAPIFLVIASNLLRAYSLQDPKDLRIRRRRSPLPSTPFWRAFLDAASVAIKRIEATQSILGEGFPKSRAELGDISHCSAETLPTQFDVALTSPPYAMALPYIDTQRLSLVWLSLVPPARIRPLEAKLIGSREFRGSARAELHTSLASNASGLPEAEAMLCYELEIAVSDEDGFRRQAVPMLLYRYLAAMQDGFRSIRRLLVPGAKFALIVGRNHSVLGGVRYDIDTPTHLANIATNVGWRISEMVPLQTYRRYGYHAKNAVESEVLLLLTRS